MSKRTIGNLLLLIAAMIWGAAFVAQSVGMELVEPFTFQAIRYFLGFLTLLPVIAVRDLSGSSRKPATKKDHRFLLLSGIGCGILLFAACSLQQLGLLTTEPGKSGFITSLYIILVPCFGLFLGKRLKLSVWISLPLAMIGLYLLCGTDGSFSMTLGELMTLGCAIAFSLHIMLIDHVANRLDGVRLSCLQFLVCSLISFVVMLILEAPVLENILRCWLPICYTGILSAGVGYTFQIIAQKHTEPTIASLLMSLESVFSVVFGWILLGDKLSGPEMIGCLLVFAGVILSQLPEKKTQLA